MEHTDRVNSAATLMVLLGEGLATSVMQHLSVDEVQKVSTAITEIEGQESHYLDHLDHLLDASDLDPVSTRVS